MPEKIIVELIMAKPGRREGPGGKDSSAPSRSTDVEGHYDGRIWIVCPYRGSRRCPVDADAPQQWYTCGNCGGSYYY